MEAEGVRRLSDGETQANKSLLQFPEALPGVETDKQSPSRVHAALRACVPKCFHAPLIPCFCGSLVGTQGVCSTTHVAAMGSPQAAMGALSIRDGNQQLPLELSGCCSHLNVNCVWDRPLIILITAM